MKVLLRNWRPAPRFINVFPRARPGFGLLRKPSIRVFDRARVSLSAAIKLVEKVGLEGEDLTDDEVGKLSTLAENLGELLRKLASSNAAETSEAIAA